MATEADKNFISQVFATCEQAIMDATRSELIDWGASGSVAQAQELIWLGLGLKCSQHELQVLRNIWEFWEQDCDWLMENSELIEAAEDAFPPELAGVMADDAWERFQLLQHWSFL